MIKNLCIAILSLTILILFKSSVEASIVEKVHNREFVVSDDHLEVTETKDTRIVEPGYQITAGAIEAFTIFNPIEGDPDNATKLQATLDSIEITDQFGNTLDFEITETDSKNYVVKATIPFTVNYYQNSIITLKYNSYGLLANSGAIKDIYIPGFPEGYAFEDDNSSEIVNTSVKVSDQYPEINFVSPSQTIENEGNFRVINIPQNDLIGTTTWIQVGTTQYYTFNIKQEIPKSSGIPFMLNTFKMPLPRNVKSGPITQKVYYTSISPEPYEMYLDEDDNLIAVFKISSSNSQIVNIQGFATLAQDNDFKITNGGNISDINEDLKSQYLNAGNFWEVDDPKIREVAKEIKGNSTDVYEITNKTYDYVVNLIDYSFVKKYGINERQGALKTLNGGAAVCMEYSDLFITLMRAQGIPARGAFGYGFGSLDYESRGDRSINHQWAEVYIPSLNTWINVDTTWGEFGSEIIGGDLNHFYSHVASIDPETPSTSEVSFFGNIDNIPDRDMTIDVVSELPEYDETSTLTQDDLIIKYPKKTSSEKLSSDLQIMKNSLNDFMDGTLEKLGIKDRATQNTIEIALAAIPFVIIFGLLVRSLFRKSKPKAAV